MWARPADKIALTFYEKAEVATVPRAVTQVLSSLYSGHLNTVTVSPYVTVALQWHDKFKYMTDMPVSIGVGATVITKEKFDALSPAQQQILRDTANAHQELLVKAIRKDNERALEALKKKAGLEVVEFEAADRAAWDAIALETHEALVGDTYSAAFLEKITAALKVYREQK